MTGDSTNTIAAGLGALMREYESTSNNIANSHTAGYKRKVTSFSTELEKTIKADTGSLAGVLKARETADFTQGQLTMTGRSLDVAMEGKGFLTLQTPEGRLYTRNGTLQINILGQLTDLNGHRVAGRTGPINIPNTVSENDITIDEKGVLRAQGMELGQMQVVEFEDPSEQLEAVGNGCFRGPEDFRPKGAVATSVKQGYREDSNVRMMEELTNMMSLSRAFEASMSMLKRQRENNAAMIDVAKS
jgi:flagellar basal body rod protein FlgG